MKIYGIQMKVKLKQEDHNYANAQTWIRKAAELGADVVVLPEMWNVGFLTDEQEDYLADEEGRKTKAFLSGLAQELGVNIVGGSVATKKGTDFFNTSYIMNREGRLVAEYDKAHLFSFVGEDKAYHAGDKLVTFQLDGINCGVILCYDLRFPEWSRKQVLAGTELLFIPAEWPLTRVDHWRILNQARAIENQVYIVAVNGCGKVDESQYNAGNSMIIHPLGSILADAGEEPKETMIYSDIDLSDVEKVRKRMKVLQDRRVDIY